MKKDKIKLFISICFLTVFILWTVLLCFVDVHPVGPQGSGVGFATINAWFHRFTGVHMGLYNITDWLSLIPLGFVLAFGFMGLCQWIKRKSLLRVDAGILGLGCEYIAVLAVFVFFENIVVNYRPVLIGNSLEASYPSSTTMLVMCVMPTAILQVKRRMKSGLWRRIIVSCLCGFSVLMVALRLISGVHWLSDIIGGALISASFYFAYCFVFPNQ